MLMLGLISHLAETLSCKPENGCFIGGNNAPVYQSNVSLYLITGLILVVILLIILIMYLKFKK